MNKLLIGAAVAVLAVSASGQWSDNFDRYNAGDQLHGLGGWEGWDGNPGVGALVSNAQAFSAPNSVDISGASDLVHDYAGYTAGMWLYSGQLYIPSNLSARTWFVLLNQYESGVGGDKDWSVDMYFDPTDDMVHNFGGSGNPFNETLVPIVYDGWVPFEVLIDLDKNLHTVKYNNQLAAEGRWYGPNGAANIGAVDLWAGGASPVYYDDLSLQMVPEPTTIAGISIGLLALLRRRGR